MLCDGEPEFTRAHDYLVHLEERHPEYLGSESDQDKEGRTIKRPCVVGVVSERHGHMRGPDWSTLTRLWRDESDPGKVVCLWRQFTDRSKPKQKAQKALNL